MDFNDLTVPDLKEILRKYNLKTSGSKSELISPLHEPDAKLKGPAKWWIDSTFVTSFLTDFPCIVNTADIHMQMMQQRMMKGESLVEYYYKMLSIGRRGQLDDNDLLQTLTSVSTSAKRNSYQWYNINTEKIFSGERRENKSI